MYVKIEFRITNSKEFCVMRLLDFVTKTKSFFV